MALTLKGNTMNKEHIESEIKRRQEEAYGYQANIDMYTMIIEELPKDEWNSETEQYKGKTPEQLADMIEDDELLIYINDLNYRDKLKRTLRMEKLALRIPEQSVRILEKMKCM